MRHGVVVVSGIVGLMMFSGCRTATHMAEVPRVDLELQGGNRGFLVGTPPEGATLKTTRQMIHTDVEIPSFYKAKHSTTPVSLGPVAAPNETGVVSAPAASSAEPVSGSFDTYVVQKGESLWTIAAKKEIYGKATGWRRIFDANRDLLKSPDRVRPGMTLKIPRSGHGGGSNVAGIDEGTTFKK